MTTFKGRKTGFNPSGSNDAVPNFMGPPATKFGGRPAVPAGPLKLYPGPVANANIGNRRLAKAHHGEDGGSLTSFNSRTAFDNGSSPMKTNTKAGSEYDTKGGNGVRRGRKT